MSAARGGVWKDFIARERPATESGIVVETSDGRLAVSERHDLNREVEYVASHSLTVSGLLHWARFETATPLKLAAFRLGLLAGGRWCRTLVRRVLQRRVIDSRHAAPIRLTRRFEFFADIASPGGFDLRLTDTIALCDRSIQVRRMSFATEHQTDYTAAGGVYQDAVLTPWTSLDHLVEELNGRRRLVIVRSIPSLNSSPWPSTR